jgi:hypothetical protein
MDAYQGRTWEGWHHPRALTLIAVGGVMGAPPRGQAGTPAGTLPPGRYGLRGLRLEVVCPRSLPAIWRHVPRPLLRHEVARFYHHRTRTGMPPPKLRRDIQ